MVGHAVEVAKTVLEVADVAWTAVETCHNHHHHYPQNHPETTPSPSPELDSLRSENQRLRSLLEENLKLLQNISLSSSLLPNCPSDLHDRLIATVDSKSFLNQLESLSLDGADCKFPFKEPSGADLEAVETLINVGSEQPSWWVWVTDEMVPSKIEERSGIDNENYVVVSEEHVVEGVANFMARCIVSCPKAKDMSPQELQKTISKALGGMNKVEKMLHIWHAGTMFYTLSTWGLAFAGLYRSRAILRYAAMGVHKTSKVVMKAL